MDDTTVVQPFDEWLAKQRRGALNDELTAAFHELVDRVTLLGRKGSLTLKINDARIVIVQDEVVVRPPKEDRPGAVWFVDDDANLFRSDPAQGKFTIDHQEEASE